jgi:hypothetical protein
MKRRILDWLLMIVAAALLNLTLRYWFGDFQGYLTVPVAGTDYGFAHIKSSTVWASGQEFTRIPGTLVFAIVLGALAWLVYEVRLVWRHSIHKP